jgi:hypothetical protein
MVVMRVTGRLGCCNWIDKEHVFHRCKDRGKGEKNTMNIAKRTRALRSFIGCYLAFNKEPILFPLFPSPKIPSKKNKKLIETYPLSFPT